MGTLVNPFQPGGAAGPHEALAALRAQGPVHRVPLPNGIPVWLVTRYAEARAALADPRLSLGSSRLLDGGALPADIRAATSTHLLTSDPPDHTRMRRLVTAAFTMRRVEALRPRVVQITSDLLDALAGRDTADLIGEFAHPLPMQVICELLGIPVEDRARFQTWSQVYVAAGGAAVFPVAEVIEFVGYLRVLVGRKRASRDDDLVTALISVRDREGRLTDDELTSMILLLLVAGHETTVNLLGTGIALLLAEPARADRLRAEPAALPAAVEEFLRYESPVPVTAFRRATQDMAIGGVPISAGEYVMISLLGANRDTDAFPAADRLDLDRAGTSHLAFGHGLHHCLGAPLARIEGQIAIGALLARHPRARLAVPAAELSWRPGVFMRGLRELPVLLG